MRQQILERTTSYRASVRRYAQTLVRLAWCGSCFSLAGCSLFQPSQLSQCQADKKEVMSKVVSQQRQIEDLQAERNRLSERLAEAEKQLAVVHDQAPNLLAEGRRPSSSSPSALDSGSRSSPRESTRDALAPNQWAPRQRRQ